MSQRTENNSENEFSFEIIPAGLQGMAHACIIQFINDERSQNSGIIRSL